MKKNPATLIVLIVSIVLISVALSSIDNKSYDKQLENKDVISLFKKGNKLVCKESLTVSKLTIVSKKDWKLVEHGFMKDETIFPMELCFKF